MKYQPYKANCQLAGHALSHLTSAVHSIMYPGKKDKSFKKNENQQFGFRPGPTQTDLYKHRKELEACNFGFK